jgi:tetratricopeptide (TPR) repeat protein
MAFFASARDHERLQEVDDPGRFLSSRSFWSLEFERLTEIPFADADIWAEHDLPVAGKDAYPVFARLGPREAFLRPDASCLAFLEGLLRALAATSEDELDSGSWSKDVQTSAGPATIHLELPGILEPEPARAGTGEHRLLDRRSLEKSMSDLSRLLEEQQLESIEDMNRFLQERLRDGEIPQATPRTPQEQAEEIFYQALDATGRRRIQLARKAIAIDPDCADAWVLRAEATGDDERALEFYRRAVESGRRALGEAAFIEDTGHFWGIHRTRPFMRALAGLAGLLDRLGRREEALPCQQELLRLNPNDNQGIRYPAAALLAEMNRDQEALEMCRTHQDEQGPFWPYLLALLEFRRAGEGEPAALQADAALRRAPQVYTYLSGKRRIPELGDDIVLGGEEEAAWAASSLLEAWTTTPGALRWLEDRSRLRKRTLEAKRKGKGRPGKGRTGRR